ncbi:MAG: Wzz/FepE/Etk N-terminal domain-containing protein [Chitinophagaceae bacterium]
MENKQDHYSFADLRSSITSFVQFCIKRWFIFLLVVSIAAALGATYFFVVQKPKYEAVTTFILEEKTPGGGGLAGLASQFGFNIASLTSGGSIFSGDNILDILKSKRIIREVLLSGTEDSAGKRSLADVYLDFSGLQKKWSKTERLSGLSFAKNVVTLSSLQDSVLNTISEKIIRKHLVVDRMNKKGSIIFVMVTAPDETFARLMTTRLVAQASKLYLDIRTGTSLENIRQLQNRSDSLLILLNAKSFAAASVQPIDINPALRTMAVPAEIASRDKSVLATLYAEVTKNLEASKLLLSQQTPVIQLLDEPGYSLEDERKGLIFLLVIFGFAGGFLLFVAMFGYYFFLRKDRDKSAFSKILNG